MDKWRVSDRLIAAGADGIRGGWIAALCIDDPKRARMRHTALKFFTDVRQLDRYRRRHGEDAPVAMDVPIGLTEEGGFRDCDREARERLGDRRSTVFAPPGRYLLEAGTTYRTVRDLVEERRRAEGAERVPGVSAQSAALIPKIREVDHLVRAYGLSAPECFLEAHPELSFHRMNGGPSPAAEAHADRTACAGAARGRALPRLRGSAGPLRHPLLAADRGHPRRLRGAVDGAALGGAEGRRRGARRPGARSAHRPRNAHGRLAVDPAFGALSLWPCSGAVENRVG